MMKMGAKCDKKYLDAAWILNKCIENLIFWMNRNFVVNFLEIQILCFREILDRRFPSDFKGNPKFY